MRITLVLADDHHLVRAALRQLLEGEPDFTVVAETSDGLDALVLVERHRPKVLVVDLMLPGMSGLGVTREVVRSWPKTGVVVLSMHANDAYVTEALRSGALGYVVKSAESADLFLAVRQAARGAALSQPRPVGAGPGRARAGKRALPPHGPERAGAAGVPVRGRGGNERPDRRAPVHQPAHGRETPRERDAEARASVRARPRAVRRGARPDSGQPRRSRGPPGEPAHRPGRQGTGVANGMCSTFAVQATMAGGIPGLAVCCADRAFP